MPRQPVPRRIVAAILLAVLGAVSLRPSPLYGEDASSEVVDSEEGTETTADEAARAGGEETEEADGGDEAGMAEAAEAADADAPARSDGAQRGADAVLPAPGPRQAAILSAVDAPPRGNRARRRGLVALLRRGGIPLGRIARQRVPDTGRDADNVLVRLPGRDPDAKPIVVGAHFDAYGRSPGAIDNWSGTVMLAALASHLHAHPPRRPFHFVGFASEEHGRVGSRHYVARMDRRQRRRTLAMINLECLGVGTLRTWANRSSDALEFCAREAAARGGLPLGRQVLFRYSTDSFSFDEAGIPSLTLHSLAPGDLHLINTGRDRPGRVDPRRMRETFGLLVLLLDALDARESPLAARDRERDLDAAGTGFVVRDAPGAEGVFVEALAPGAPERRAGLRPGDRLLRLGDEPIRGLRQLEPMLLTLHRGQTVTLALERKVDGVAHRLDLAVDY